MIIYKKIYLYLGVLVFIMGQTLIFYDTKIGSIVLLGILAPMLMSYINILIILKLTKKKGNVAAFGYNIAQFLIKTIFLCFLTYTGVKVMQLDFRIFVPVLCITWFVFHLIEGFFTNTLIKENNTLKESE